MPHDQREDNALLEQVAQALAVEDGHCDPDDWPGELTERWTSYYRRLASAAIDAVAAINAVAEARLGPPDERPDNYNPTGQVRE